MAPHCSWLIVVGWRLLDDVTRDATASGCVLCVPVFLSGLGLRVSRDLERGSVVLTIPRKVFWPDHKKLDFKLGSVRRSQWQIAALAPDERCVVLATSIFSCQWKWNRPYSGPVLPPTMQEQQEPIYLEIVNERFPRYVILAWYPTARTAKVDLISCWVRWTNNFKLTGSQFFFI